MKQSIYEFDDYKLYLAEHLKRLPKRGYGFKSRLARAAGCRTAYIAQILNGAAHLSLEQAEGVNELLGHDDHEGEYFLVQVQSARAGSQALRRRLNRQLSSLRTRQQDLKKRFNVRDRMTQAELAEFFSQWSFAAVQLASALPHLRSREELRVALGMNLNLFNETVTFLQQRGLLSDKTGRLEPGNTRIFIGRDSPVLKMHHANWRQKAVSALDHVTEGDVHFTSLYTLSHNDAVQIQNSLIRQIQKIRATVKDSADEELHAFTLDFFRVDLPATERPSAVDK